MKEQNKYGSNEVEYSFKTYSKIEFCYNCPCCNESNSICKIDSELRYTETYRPMWCPLQEKAFLKSA